MKPMRSRLLFSAALLALVSAPALAQTPAPSAPAASKGISQSAMSLLKQMSETIGGAQAFTFHADILSDHVLPSGQKLQFAAGEDVALKRPGALYVEWSGDLGDRQFWYDGSKVTLFDPATPFYATASAPPTIDAMLTDLLPKAGFVPPLSDLLYADPFGALGARIKYAVDLGSGDVRGKSCRVLAFVEKDIDWQIWIAPGDKPTPCKLVITYKTQPSQPQFSATFTSWDFSPTLTPAVFSAAPPPGLKQIPFAGREAAK